LFTSNRKRRSLPVGFDYGASTSAAQIEGAAAAGGRTPSIWDVFAQLPGRIVDGSTPQLGIDHFHRWASDLEMLAELGATAYRMSLSWSRIQPRGRGAASRDGIDFYDRVIDALLTAGIAPFVSLYHADMPLEVMENGGWLARQSVELFADFAELAAIAIGDRVDAWATLDEPLVQNAFGYAVGIDAPGLTLLGGAFQAAHHQLLAHGRATQALRANSKGRVGIVNHHTTVDAATPTGADLTAARFYDIYHNRQFTDPLFNGKYPAAVLAMPEAPTEVILDGDLACISAPLDYYGVSYAHPTVIAAARENRSVPFSLEPFPGAELTPAGWPVHPQSLTRLLMDLSQRYPGLPPVYVTGAGGAFDDQHVDGVTQPDLHRIAYLDGHLDAVAAAVEQGCDVRGYFHRSLFDSWEWTEGFTRRFGLVEVDPVSLERTPRASFAHYRALIRSG
jgi:beta-glucosidase